MHVNGEPLDSIEPKNIQSAIYSCVHDLHLWSFDALFYFYIESMKLTIEACEWEREGLKGGARARYTRFITLCNKQIRNIKIRRNLTRDYLLQHIYNEILKTENLSIIH